MCDGGVPEVLGEAARDCTCQRLLRSTTTSAQHTMVSCGRPRWRDTWILTALVSPTQTLQNLLAPAVLHLVLQNHLARPSGMSSCAACDELDH